MVDNPAVPKKQGFPVFSIIAAVVAALSLFTPALLLSLPVIVAVVAAIIGGVRKERPLWLPYAAGGLAVVLLIASQMHWRGGETFSSETSSATPVLSWQYNSAKDEMRGTVSRWATIDSPTPLNLQPPYDQAGNVATLEVSKYGAVIVLVTVGQFTGCELPSSTVAVKFDNGPVWDYPCSEATNGQSNTLYVNPAGEMKPRQPTDPMDGLRKAKTMTIEVEFFQDGMRQLTFNVAGLDQSKL